MTPTDLAARLAAAREELLTKGSSGIQRETAMAWLFRALACYALAEERQCVRWLHEAGGYAGEALEHAGETGDAELVGQIEAILDQARESAFTACGG
jgi:hypothetical protein